MPYQVEWHDAEQTIIRVNTIGMVSWQEWHKVICQLSDLLIHHEGRVDVILDEQADFPCGNPLPHLKNTLTILEQFPQLGLVVNVSARHSIAQVKSMLAIAASVYAASAKRYDLMAPTLDDALSLVANARSESCS